MNVLELSVNLSSILEPTAFNICGISKLYGPENTGNSTTSMQNIFHDLRYKILSHSNRQSINPIKDRLAICDNFTDADDELCISRTERKQEVECI